MGGVAESAPSGAHDDVLLWISCMGGLEKRDLLGEEGGREDASVGNGGRWTLFKREADHSTSTGLR